LLWTEFLPVVFLKSVLKLDVHVQSLTKVKT
jgi:hypothetical protein